MILLFKYYHTKKKSWALIKGLLFTSYSPIVVERFYLIYDVKINFASNLLSSNL
jgi:hypothetical protein